MRIHNKSERIPFAKTEQQNRDARFAMWLSLIVVFLMLVSKVTAYLFTACAPSRFCLAMPRSAIRHSTCICPAAICRRSPVRWKQSRFQVLIK